jgi:hypothetical protein
VPGTPTWLVARYTDVTPPAPPAKPAAPAKPAPPAPDRSGPTFAFNSRTALYARGARLRGTVTDPSKVRLMQVAVGRRNRRGRCYWWSATRRRLSATARSCSRPRWITAKLGAPSAKGAHRWVARLRRALPRGRYRIALKAVDGRGNVSRRVGNALTLKRR